jgi:hypothetical protein
MLCLLKGFSEKVNYFTEAAKRLPRFFPQQQSKKYLNSSPQT